MTDLRTHLSLDHLRTMTRVDHLLDSPEAGVRSDVLSALRQELSAHHQAEQEVVYSALARRGGEAELLALEGQEEHELLERILLSLASSGKKDAPRWTARCRMLKAYLQHHFEEEEREVFDLLGRIFTQRELDDLGLMFEGAKQVLIH
ncbi:MAG: hemerythrin domain-containing protein [Planctomycetota bacterium]